ncbi:2516_t:CDS:2 [Acaulospora morrowiae]|uniref:2516_t:CDS:1 n=1 Tax=Acaulospora morrowiae TaxID=94023 RepID=A0A9N9B5A4_9GLOM|nr:2516_t:CDS:2 [Acaulospora morrowiae]
MKHWDCGNKSINNSSEFNSSEESDSDNGPPEKNILNVNLGKKKKRLWIAQLKKYIPIEASIDTGANERSTCIFVFIDKSTPGNS